MRYLALLSILVTTGLAACDTGASSPKARPENKYAITGVAIVDVEKGTILPSQTVIIVGDRIDQIGAQEEMDIPENAVLVDGRGLYLMPGLADAHVHYFDAPVFGRLMIANGILLVRDMGMPNDYILPLRDELNRGETLGPEMIATGAILDGVPPLISSISLGIQSPEDGREAVRKQAAAGVDLIKVYSGLKKEVFLAIVDEAQKHGLRIVGHVPEEIYIEDAAAAGLRSSEHFFGFEKVIAKLLGEKVNLTYTGQGTEAAYFSRLSEVDPQALQEVYERLRVNGLTVCPTVVVFKTGTNISAMKAGEFPRSEYISPTVQALWKSQWSSQNDIPEFIWENWMQMVTGLYQAGVPLMIGTDLTVPGIIPGYSVHEEMAIWQEAGIPPADILRSATLVPVEFKGQGDRLGSIREGKTASVILVRGNPLEDIRNAQQIESVFLRGGYFTRQDLDRLLDEARDLARDQVPE